MIKFFRNIRQRLLNEGDMKSYILYAIGEILLVVIGILIALQINNWNQSRFDRKQEVEYLVRMRQDLQADVENWNQKLITINYKSDFLIDYLNNKMDSLHYSKRNNTHLFSARFRTLPIANKNALEEFTSTGKIGLIQNLELKEKILRYYSFVEDRSKNLENTFSDLPRLLSELIEGELHYKVRVRAAKFQQKEIEELINILKKNRSQLEPAINAELGYTAIQYQSYNDIKKRAKSLLELLDQELKSRKCYAKILSL